VGVPCGDETGDDYAAPEWEAGASISTTRADIRFDGEADYELEQHAVAASFGRRFGERTTVRLSLGAIVGGELLGEGRAYRIGPGWLLGVSGAHRLFGLPEHAHFVTLGLSFGAASSATEEIGGAGESERISASDLRVSVLGGVTLWRTWSPYAVVRGFGGPVSFRQLGRDRTGSDVHHYAIGAGSAVGLPFGLQGAVEYTALGERTLSAGLVLAF
jgi:hypothetical protein